MMNYQDIDEARRKAQNEIRLADIAIREAAQLICGRLKSSGVSGGALYDLKKELADFNLKTYEWKQK